RRSTPAPSTTCSSGLLSSRPARRRSSSHTGFPPCAWRIELSSWPTAASPNRAVTVDCSRRADATRRCSSSRLPATADSGAANEAFVTPMQSLSGANVQERHLGSIGREDGHASALHADATLDQVRQAGRAAGAVLGRCRRPPPLVVHLRRRTRALR